MAYQYPFKAADEKKKQAVWAKGSKIEEYDEKVWRRDKCGRALKYSDHGKEGKNGWEIDHIKPSAKGGSDALSNLQPLWWSHNRSKGDTYPWSCP